MRKISSFILFFALQVVLWSCSEKEEVSVWDRTDFEEEADIDLERFSEVTSKLFDIGYPELVTGDEELTYTPIWGEVLSQVAPTVYSMPMVDSKAARAWFDEHCVPYDMLDSISSITGNITIYFNDYGTISYKEYASSDILGSIEINFPSIPAVTAINFIPVDLWPNNGGSSPCSEGDIVLDKHTRIYYLCVRGASAYSSGYLISFDSRVNDYENNYIRFTDEKKDFTIGKGASKEAWENLGAYYASCIDDITTFESVIRGIYDNVPSEHKNGVSWLVNSMGMNGLFCGTDAHRYMKYDRIHSYYNPSGTLYKWKKKQVYRVKGGRVDLNPVLVFNVKDRKKNDPSNLETYFLHDYAIIAQEDYVPELDDKFVPAHSIIFGVDDKQFLNSGNLVVIYGNEN